MSAVWAAVLGAGIGLYFCLAWWVFVGLQHYNRTEFPHSWRAGASVPVARAAFAVLGSWHPMPLIDAIRGHHRAHKEKQSDGHRQAETSDRDRGGAGDDARASDPGTFYATGGTLRTGAGSGVAAPYASGNAACGEVCDEGPTSVRGYICNADPGHSGDHAAYGRSHTRPSHTWARTGSYLAGAISQAYGLPQSIVGSLPANVTRTMLGYAPLEPAPAEPLPTEQRTIPIVAWKQAYLSATPDGRRVQLSSTGWGGHVHQPEAVATCAQGANHKAPHPTCGPPGCGFYALPSADQAPAAGGLVRLEVELSGRVIEHERGFRAEKQRILSVAVDGQCRGFLCDNAPSRVVFPAEQVQKDYVTITYGTPTPNWKPPSVCCDEHVGDQGDRAVTLDKLSTHLGVPVKWAS